MHRVDKGNVYDPCSIEHFSVLVGFSGVSRHDGEDGDDGDNGFIPGMSFVCSLRRKKYGIVLIVEILASERLTKKMEKERDKKGL